MERRALLAIALSAVVFLLFLYVNQRFFPPPPPPEAPPPRTAEAPAPAGPEAPPPPPPPVVRERQPAPPPKEIRVETPLYRAVFTTDGARVREWVLKYRGDKPLALPPEALPLELRLSRPDGEERLTYEVEPDGLVLGPGRPSGELRFTAVDRYGLKVTKLIRFTADSYQLEVQLKLENLQKLPQGVEGALVWTAPPYVGADGGGNQELGRLIEYRGGQVWSPKEEEPGARPEAGREPKAGQPFERLVEDPRGWVALENDYYLAAVLPVESVPLLVARTPEASRAGLALRGVRLGPGQAWEVTARLYVGPKEYSRLAALGVRLEAVVFRAWTFFWVLPMEWFAFPLLWLMNFFTQHLGGNYGVGIILLTVVVKLLFYPLTQKGMASMKQMQALQPQINALRAKYKNDNQRLQREMMELYRKHKINPMGGCLPILVQIPIFYALYVTLSAAVELQGAPLLCLGRAWEWLPLIGGQKLWICDLSKLDPTYILPILMGASMFLQQKMTPMVGDPRQAKLMMFMPILFTFMFLNFPSGLVLYWLVNNVLSIAQQYLIDRRARLAGPVAAEPKAARKGQPKEHKA